MGFKIRLHFPILLYFILLFSFPLLSSQNVLAANVVLYDNFDDGNKDGWTTDTFPICETSPEWMIINGKIGIEINETVCDTRAIAQHNIIPENSNYILEVDISFPGNINEDRNILFKYADNSHRYGLHIYGKYIHYERHNGSNSVSPPHGNSYFYNFQPNFEYHFIFHVTNEYVRIQIEDNFDITIPEPNEPFPNNTIALRAGTGLTGHTKVWFDNVKVTLLEDGEESPEEPKKLNVIDYKQFTGGWENDEYDSAEDWSTNPNMSRWGCAVTSAAMVLDYYGLGATPRSLNNWLKSQSDGYTRNGAVMWPAITRYTKENGNTLEFAYIGYSNTTFKNEIEADRPPIIKLDNTFGGNHFIVGKGLTSEDDDFTINDPGSSSNPNLSDANNYWGSSLNIGRFKETNSDLSYIV